MKCNLKYASIILFILLLPNIAFTEINDYSEHPILLQDMKNFFAVGYGIASAPLSFNSKDWAQTGLYSTGTVLLFTVDKKVKSFALDNRTNTNDRIFNFDSYHGNHYSLYLSLGIYGYGYFSQNSYVRKIGLQATEAFVYSGALTSLLKVLLGRERPYVAESNLKFKPFQFSNNDFQALPSGHTTVSFAVSTVLAKSIDNTFWKIFCFGSAGMVAASRVYHNKHWISDVFLGAVIGYKIGNYVIAFNNNNNRERLVGYQIYPYFGFNELGLRVNLN